jgi:hypothetical protein
VAKYRQLLAAAGYRMEGVQSAEALLSKCSELPKPDVVIMDSTMTDSLGQMRTVLLDPGVAVLLVAPEDEAAREEMKTRYASLGVIGAVGSTPNAKELESALALVTRPEIETKLVDKLLSGISAQAAQSLAAIDAKAAPYRMGEVVPALRAALAYKNDAVLVPTLKALGSIGAAEAVQDVLKVAAKDDNSKDVRVAALNALAGMFECTGEVSPDVFEILTPITKDADADVAFAACRAVTLAKFNPEQFTDLVLKKRVEEIKAGLPQ